MIDKENYTLAEQRSKELMSLSLEGLRYFQTYDWLFLRGVVTAGYIGWCIFCLQFVIRNFVLLARSRSQIQISRTSGVIVSWSLELIIMCLTILLD